MSAAPADRAPQETGAAPDLTVRPIDPARDAALAERVLAVQHAAYAVEARITGYSGNPPLHETVLDVMAVPLSWLGAFDGSGRLLGVLGWTATDVAVDIDRLAVTPDVAHSGVGSPLVEALLTVAGDRPVTATTGRGDRAAAQLYIGLGFEHVGDIEPVPSLWVSEFVRAAPGS